MTTVGDDGPRQRPDRPVQLERVAVGLLVGVVAIPVIQLALATRRGFDFTDEGLYLLSIQHPRSVLRSTTQFQIPLSVLWWIVPSVPIIRLVKLIALLVSSFVLAWSVNGPLGCAPAERYGWERVASITGITLLGVTPYLWLPQTPGYNDLSGVCGLLIVGCILIVTTRQLPQGVERALLTLVGLSATMLFLAKWPAGVLFGLATGATLWYADRDERRSRLGFAAIGISIGVSIAQLVSGSLFEMIRGMRRGARDLPDEYRISEILTDNWEELRGLPEFALRERPLTTAVMLSTALMIAFAGHRRAVQVGGAGGVACLVGWLWWRSRLGLPVDQHARTLTVCIGLGLLLIVIVWALCGTGSECQPVRNDKLIAAAASLLGPFALAVGSNNSLLLMASTLGAPLWGSGLVLTVAAVPRAHRAGPAVSALVGVLGLATVFLGANATVSNPYRQLPLDMATVPITDGPLAGLRVDPLTADVVETALALVADLDDPYVIGMLELPGIAAATGAVQPAFGWIPESAIERGTESLVRACSAGGRGVMLVLTDADLEPDDIVDDCDGRRWVHRTVRRTATGTELSFWTASAVTP